MLLLDVTPITPDADTAQSWVDAELARSEYHASFGLLHRVLARAIEGFYSLFGSGTGDFEPEKYILIFFFIVLLVLVVVAFLTPVRLRNRRSTSVLDDNETSSTEYYDRMHQAAENAQWDDALVWGMRLYARTLHDRHLVSVTPGLTAQEVAARAGKCLPQHRENITRIASVFDGVRYGTIHASLEDYSLLATLISDASSTQGVS